MYESRYRCDCDWQWFLLFTTLNTKLFRALMVLPVRRSSQIDCSLYPGLFENFDNWVASRSVWLLSIFWVRTNSFLRLRSLGLLVVLHNWGLFDPLPTLMLSLVFFLGGWCVFWFTELFWMAYSRCGRTKDLHKGWKISFVRHVI